MDSVVADELMPMNPASDCNDNSIPFQIPSNENELVYIVWQNLSYDVIQKKKKRNFWPFATDNVVEKRVLSSVNGYLKSGSITGLMGASTSTNALIDCLSGRKKSGINGVSGQICFRFTGSDPDTRNNQRSVVKISSENISFEELKVKETLILASKMLNSKFSTARHEDYVQQLIEAAGLQNDSSSKLSQLSPEKRKLVNICKELTLSPRLLILEEDASGVTETFMQSIRKLISISIPSPPAVLMTITRPRNEVVMLFDNIYLLNVYGCNIYSGPPNNLIPFMRQCGCPERSNINIADYALDVASAKHGTDVFSSLIIRSKNEISKTFLGTDYCDISLAQHKDWSGRRGVRSFLFQVGNLFHRELKSCFMSGRLFVHLLIYVLSALSVTHLFDSPVGLEDSCWQTLIGGEGIMTSNMTSDGDYSVALRKSVMNIMIKLSSEGGLTPLVMRMTGPIAWLVSISLLLMSLTSILTLMSFTSQLVIVSHEIRNSYYNTFAYSIAKLAAEQLILFFLLVPAVLYAYLASRYPLDPLRLLIFISICYLTASLGLAKGFLFSILFRKHRMAGTTAVALDVSFMVLLSGIFVKTVQMVPLLRPLHIISDFRYTFEAILISLYGLGRCGDMDVIQYVYDMIHQPKLIRILQAFWSGFNVSKVDGKWLELILDLDEGYTDKLIEGLDMYLGGYEMTVSEERAELSLLLTILNVRESAFLFNITFLILKLLLILLLSFISIKVHMWSHNYIDSDSGFRLQLTAFLNRLTSR